MEFFKDAGVWESVVSLFERQGFSVSGSMFDGFCHRILINGPKDEYASGATVVSTVGLRMPEPGQLTDYNPSYCDPIGDPVVLDYVRRCQLKSEKRFCTSCQRCEHSCCGFSRHVEEVLNDSQNLSEDRMLRVVKEQWKKINQK